MSNSITNTLDGVDSEYEKAKKRLFANKNKQLYSQLKMK